MQARRLLNEIKFPELHGQCCRALPYDKELLRNCAPRSNLFVKGFGTHWTHKDLHEAFAEFGQVVSARVSICDGYESRGFGFVQFLTAEAAERACQVMDSKVISLSADVNFTLRVAIFLSKTEREVKSDEFNNLYVKNFPAGCDFGEAELSKLFEPFGALASVKISESRQYGFVAFKECKDAQAALSHFSKPENSALEMLVTRCLKRTERQKQLRKDTIRFVRELARNNLYFKGFPASADDSVEEMTEELRQYFSKFGDIKSLKLPTKTVVSDDGQSHERLLGFGFVSYQNMEAAQKARFDVPKEMFRSVHKITVSQFEWKEQRQAHMMEQYD